LGVYFDGQKDNTFYQEKNRNKMYIKLKKEEHISLIQEPGGQFLSPKSGTGCEIAKTILYYLQIKYFDFDKLVAIGSDGTARNIG